MEHSVFFEKILHEEALEYLTSFCKKYSHISIDLKDHSLELIFQKYEKYRNEYKELNFPNKGKVDRHKLISFLICAFLELQPIKSNIPMYKNNSYSIKYFPNELFIIHFSLLILKLFIVEDWKKKSIPKENIKSFLNTKWQFPKCSCVDDKYLMTLIRDLYAFRLNKNSTNFSDLIYLLSHVVFFLEDFHLKNSNY